MDSCTVEPGDTISYEGLFRKEGIGPAQFMNYRIGEAHSVLLQEDPSDGVQGVQAEDDGGTLIITGHDSPVSEGRPETKAIDQPMLNGDGALSQNGLFFQSARAARAGEGPIEGVRVYLKTNPEECVYRGFYRLTDAWTEATTPKGGRRVFKFRLVLDKNDPPET